ncbi:MAG: hypothetical protein WEA82_11855 [Idiomarina sp.]
MRRHARAGYWSMLLTAWLLLLAGLGLLIVPQQALSLIAGFGAAAAQTPLTVVLLQLLGAVYFGFGAMNWMARGQILGGIYGRPICLGNLFHFAAGTILLAINIATGVESLGILITAAVYLLLCLIFIRLTFRMPSIAEHL